MPDPYPELESKLCPPVCLRKLCRGLRAGPAPYLTRRMPFCRRNRLDPESGWHDKALATDRE
jgi:hypothetical protein